jgi:hypothetical protein
MENFENKKNNNTKTDLLNILDANHNNKLEKEELEQLGLKVNLKQLENEVINSNWKKYIPEKYQTEIENKTSEEKKAYIYLFQAGKELLGEKEYSVLTQALDLKEIVPFLYELIQVEKTKHLLQTATIILTQDEIEELKKLLASNATKEKLSKLKEFIENQLNENITSAQLIQGTKFEKALEKQNKNPYEIAKNVDEVWFSFLENYFSKAGAKK